jgi:hypothetical protein
MGYGGTCTDEEEEDEEYPKEPSWLGYLHFTLGVLVGCKWFLYNYCISLTEKDGQGVWCNVLPHEPPAIPGPPSSANSIQDGNLMAPATPPSSQVEEAGNSTVAPVTTAPGAAAALTPAAASTTTTQEEKSTVAAATAGVTTSTQEGKTVAAAAPSANPAATKETVAPKKKGDALTTRLNPLQNLCIILDLQALSLASRIQKEKKKKTFFILWCLENCKSRC